MPTSASTMSGGVARGAAIAWSPSLDGDDVDVLVGERQLDDALNRDAVVGQKQGMRHVALIGTKAGYAGPSVARFAGVRPLRGRSR